MSSGDCSLYGRYRPHTVFVWCWGKAGEASLFEEVTLQWLAALNLSPSPSELFSITPCTACRPCSQRQQGLELWAGNRGVSLTYMAQAVCSSSSSSPLSHSCSLSLFSSPLFTLSAVWQHLVDLLLSSSPQENTVLCSSFNTWAGSFVRGGAVLLERCQQACTADRCGHSSGE